MTSARKMGVRISGLTSFLTYACLMTTGLSLPTYKERAGDSTAQTSHQAVPLPKLSNFKFPGDHEPPQFHGVSVSDLTSFTQVESIPPSTESANANVGYHDIEERDIIGTDNRAVIQNSSFPYSAIGRILWSDGSYCTGTLVGDRIVATASHCVPWGQSSISMVFQPAFYDTNVLPSATVTNITYVIQQTSANFDNSACGLAKDFAILKLGTVLSGYTGGYFGVASAVASGLVHQGYPTDLANGARPYQQTGLTATVSTSLRCDATGPLSTVADAVGGQSGGPLYIPQIRVVVGVLSAGTSTNTAFASGSQFVNLVNWARTNWPA